MGEWDGYCQLWIGSLPHSLLRASKKMGAKKRVVNHSIAILLPKQPAGKGDL
jgi:hypothetical protein